MKYRQLGSTGIVVSEIGFGAWGIGGWSPGQLSYGETDDGTSLSALTRAFEHGIRFFDTSSLYGLGKSELLVGEAFKKIRSEVVIATKAGYRDYSSPPDYSPKALEASLDESLARLDTDYVDLFQLHGPSVGLLRQRPEIVDCLRDLRKTGKIRTFGLSTESPEEGLSAITEFAFPVIQVNFNMLDLRALECGLFGRAREAGTGVIARTPLAFGFLAGNIAPDTVFPENDHRNRWNGTRVTDWVEKAESAIDAVTEIGQQQSPVQLALRFCISYPEISTVIPGILTASESEENAAASESGGLPVSALKKILALNLAKPF